MICELFPFQKQAVNEMRLRVAMALNNYRMLKLPQVVSLQAPTGSGKTIIMTLLTATGTVGIQESGERSQSNLYRPERKERKYTCIGSYVFQHGRNRLAGTPDTSGGKRR